MHDAAPRPAGAAAAILAATEELLRERPLSECSVADIIGAAGVSRTTFYAHFPSKTAVIAEALRRAMDEVVAAVGAGRGTAAGGAGGGTAAAGDAEAAIRGSVARWAEVCRRHGPLLRTACQEWPHDPELRQLWCGMLEAWTEGTARRIAGARDRDAAPAPAPAPAADPRALAACLMWGFERVLHVSLVGADAALPDPAVIVEPLAQMMLGAVYGRAGAA